MQRAARIRHALVVLLALLALPAMATPPARESYRIIGYAVDWQPAQNPEARKIDTLIFAFATLADGRVTLDASAAAKVRKLLALKALAPRLKVVISVGGWGVGGFSEAAASAAGRRRFADSAAQMVADRGADGLDIDWEYPGHGEAGIASSPADRANFTLLLKAARASLDRIGATHGRTGADLYTLSAAVADGPFVSGIDIPAVAPLLDWFNLMTYDFHNSLTPTTGHHAALYASALSPADDRTVDRAVRQYLEAGVPPAKLVIGAAFYGREFAAVVPAHDGLLQAWGKFVGAPSWLELKRDYIDRNGYVRLWDPEARAAWLWNPHTQHFVTYDDPQALAAKAAYVKQQHLGGIMYWEQSLDPDGELLDVLWRDLQ